MYMESDTWEDIRKDADQMTFPPIQFVDISDRYSILQDLEVMVQFGQKFVATIDDWVGLFPLGWRTLKQYVAYQWIHEPAKNGQQCITISKSKLPNDQHQYYQFMYINGNTTVVGASAPFCFTDEELFIDAKSEDEAEKELFCREFRIVEKEIMQKQELKGKSVSVMTLATESKLEIDEDSFTSIIADPNCICDVNKSQSRSEFYHMAKRSASGDNPEFGDSNAESMALVPWLNADELVWCESLINIPVLPTISNLSELHQQVRSKDDDSKHLDENIKYSRIQGNDKLDLTKTDAIPLDEINTTHISCVLVSSSDKSTPVKRSNSKQHVNSSKTSIETVELESSAKTTKKDAHLDQVVSRFLSFFGSVITRKEKDDDIGSENPVIPCSRCRQLELDLESTKSRALHAEYREGALVREVVNLRKQVKQQELRTAELLDHLHLRCGENNSVDILKGQLNQVMNELQQAVHTIHRLSAEKINLETKIGNLVWEKAGLCAKLQVLQQGEARNSKRSSELSTALVEAQEEVHHLSKKQGESEQFVEALLATLATLGFSNVSDPTGSSINLENIAGPGLHLEPVSEENTNNWTETPTIQYPEKWYNAIVTSREIILQLQSKIHDLEDYCKEHEKSTNRIIDVQKSLDEERKKSKLLESQIVLSLPTQESQSPISPLFEKTNFAIQDVIVNQSTIELDPSNLGYELQGARPKFITRQQLVNPVGELNQDAESIRSCSYNPSATCVDNYPQSCPYCGETFSPYLLPNDKQEHIRMHIYSELQRSMPSNILN